MVFDFFFAKPNSDSTWTHSVHINAITIAGMVAASSLALTVVTKKYYPFTLFLNHFNFKGNSCATLTINRENTNTNASHFNEHRPLKYNSEDHTDDFSTSSPRLLSSKRIAPILIIYGSQTGTSKAYATALYREAQERLLNSHLVELLNPADFNTENITKEGGDEENEIEVKNSIDISFLKSMLNGRKIVIILASTTGRGEPCSNFKPFFLALKRFNESMSKTKPMSDSIQPITIPTNGIFDEEINMEQKKKLPLLPSSERQENTNKGLFYHTTFALLAFGNSQYETFCGCAKETFSLLKGIGMPPLFPLVCVDEKGDVPVDMLVSEWMEIVLARLEAETSNGVEKIMKMLNTPMFGVTTGRERTFAAVKGKNEVLLPTTSVVVSDDAHASCHKEILSQTIFSIVDHTQLKAAHRARNALQFPLCLETLRFQLSSPSQVLKSNKGDGKADDSKTTQLSSQEGTTTSRSSLYPEAPSIAPATVHNPALLPIVFKVHLQKALQDALMREKNEKYTSQQRHHDKHSYPFLANVHHTTDLSFSPTENNKKYKSNNCACLSSDNDDSYSMTTTTSSSYEDPALLHLSFSINHHSGIKYEAGDHLGIYAYNSHSTTEEFLDTLLERQGKLRRDFGEQAFRERGGDGREERVVMKNVMREWLGIGKELQGKRRNKFLQVNNIKMIEEMEFINMLMVHDGRKTLMHNLLVDFRSPIRKKNRAENTNALPAITTLYNVFRCYLDLTGQPRKITLRAFARCCVDPQEAALFRALIDGVNNDFSSSVCEETDVVDIPESLRHLQLSAQQENQHEKQKNSYISSPPIRRIIDYLRAFPSCLIPLDFCISSLPRIYARFYSIASDSTRHPHEIHIIAKVVRAGLATSFLAQQVHAATSQRQQHQSHENAVYAFVRKSTYHLPSLKVMRTRRLLFVGPGTGVAPLIGFLDRRLGLLLKTQSRLKGGKCPLANKQTHQAKEGNINCDSGDSEAGTPLFASCYFFTGCRNFNKDASLRILLTQSDGILVKHLSDVVVLPISVALSKQADEPLRPLPLATRGGGRGDPYPAHGDDFEDISILWEFGGGGEGIPGVYVQELIRRKKTLLLRDILLNNDSAIYICGDASGMAKDVEKTLVDLLAEADGRPRDAAIAHIEMMKKNGRFLKDIW